MSDSDEWFRRDLARLRAELDAKLARAKPEAHQRGKQPFDLDAFEKKFEPIPDEVESRESRLHRYECDYYLTFPGILTIDAYARRLIELEVWKDST